MVATEIRRREDIQDLQKKGDTIFGQCVSLDNRTHSPSKLTVLLDRSTVSDRTIASPWIFFTIFDPDSFMFAPVAKVRGKPFRCFLCRIPLSRRGVCGHDDSAKTACETFRKNRDPGSGVGLLLDMAFPNNGSDENHTQSNLDAVGANEENDADGDRDLNGNGGNNQSISVPEIFTPIDVRRPIIPCRGEWNDMINIAKALDAARETDIIILDDRVEGKCHKCAQPHTGQNHEGYARTFYLFTIYHGTHKIRVYDWWCPVCEKTRRFSGRGSGKYPATQNTAYTTELLYHWLEMTCFQGYSFRNAYRTTRAFQITASRTLMGKRKKYNGTGAGQNGMNGLTGDQNVDRRRANDALRELLKLLDTNSPMMTGVLYSCSTCEESLTPADCVEIGISEQEVTRLKIYKTVVIDGTASGILTSLPTLEREYVSVPPPKKSKAAIRKLQKLLKSNPNRKVLKEVMKRTKECFREWKGKASSLSLISPLGTEPHLLRFCINKIGANSHRGILEPQKLLTEPEVKAVKLLLLEAPCFCPFSLPNTAGLRRITASKRKHVRECVRLNKLFSNGKEEKVVLELLRHLFSLNEGNPALTGGQRNDIEAGENTEAKEETDSGNGCAQVHDSDAQDIAEDGDGSDSRNIEAQGNGIEVEENAAHAHESDNRVQSSGEDEDAESQNSSEEAEKEIREIYNEVLQRRHVSGIWLTLTPPFGDMHAQLFESTILLVEFLLLEHVGMPYVGRFENGTGNTMTSFCGKSMKVHDDVMSALTMFSEPYTASCNSNTEDHSIHRKCQCFSRLRRAALSVSVANPILSAFCQEMLKLQKPLESAHKTFVKSLIKVLAYHMNTAKKYFSLFERKCSKKCLEYWNLRGKENTMIGSTAHSAQPDQESTQLVHDEEEEKDGNNEQKRALREARIFAEEELEQSLSSGICFSGKKRYRPCIIYQAANEEFCNKNYKKSRSHFPGLMTVQCSCHSPKLIGFIFMTRAESTSLALSSFLSNLAIPPRTVYYDNACNLFQSVMLRVPWILKYTRLEVDRFHYKSHTCCSYFDPDVYQAFDSHHTETAESINARIKTTLHQIRYLKGKHLIPFLRALFCFIKLAATFKATYHTDDLEGEDLTLFFQEICKCSCSSCQAEKRENPPQVVE